MSAHSSKLSEWSRGLLPCSSSVRGAQMTMLLVISGSSAPLLGVALADGSGAADGVSRADVGVASGVGLGASAGVLVSVFGVSMSVLLAGFSGAYDG